MALLRVTLAWLPMLAATLAAALAQEEPIPPERASKPPVAITFAPPDLEGEIVLGIFDSAKKLVRTLRFEPGAPDLKIDTNGYIASWDGRDENADPCPAGRYFARGYVVGDDVTVSGEAFYFNDWVAEDKIPATGVELCRWPEAFGVKIATGADRGPVFAKIHPDGTLEPTAEPPVAPEEFAPPASITPAPLAGTPGRDGSTWLIVADGPQRVVTQLAKDGSTERTLRVAADEPQPAEILASATEDAILLRETGRAGVERVRLLRRAAKAAAAADGKVVADWEVAFERARQPCADFGVSDGRLVAGAADAAPGKKVEIKLVPNALHPGPESLTLEAAATTAGSALRAPDGLALVEISAGGKWSRFAVVPEKNGRAATLYQGDGVVVERFALTNLDRIAAFDAGSFLLAPAQ